MACYSKYKSKYKSAVCELQAGLLKNSCYSLCHNVCLLLLDQVENSHFQ